MKERRLHLGWIVGGVCLTAVIGLSVQTSRAHPQYNWNGNGCIMCHGDGVVGGGVIPDLRHMDADKHQMWMGIVMGGLHRERGMVSFAEALTAEEATAIQAYVIERAHEMLETAQ